MPYKLPILSCCLLALAVTISCAAAQAQTNGAASATSAAPGQEQDKPKSSEAAGERIYKGKEVDKKPVIKDKPQPIYPMAARDQGQEGTVVLRCVFAASGKVTNIHVVVELPYGLTQAAVDAASHIKFKPAMKDGKPVSIWMELQYNFHL